MPFERHERTINEPGLKHSEGVELVRDWFEDAYQGMTSRGKNLAASAYDLVKAHPGEAAIVGGVVVIGVCAALRGNSKIVEKELAAGEKIVSKAEAKTAFEAPQLERKTIEGNLIPDVLRPTVEKGTHLTTPEALAATGQKYHAGLIDLFNLSKSLVAEDGHTMADVATTALKSRAATTGERFTEAAAKAEAERLLVLNPSLADATNLGGMNVTVLDQAHLIKLAGGDLQFKFTPQLGQFLKATGKITEEHISEAMTLQKAGNKKMLGEILVDLGHAEKADIDLAFAEQNTVKAAIKAVREQYLLTL